MKTYMSVSVDFRNNDFLGGWLYIANNKDILCSVPINDKETAMKYLHQTEKRLHHAAHLRVNQYDAAICSKEIYGYID